MDLRELKALQIAASLKIVCSSGVWTIPSQTGKGSYRVTLGETPTCECEDFTLRGARGESREWCKHILAARIVHARECSGNEPRIKEPDAVPKRPTYRQNWPLYNLAQQTEKHRFQELLFDLCRGIEEPDRKGKPGQKPHTLRDQVFAACYKVFSGFSSRRFSCDIADAFEQGYTARLVPGAKTPAFFENSALRPILVHLIQQSALPLRTIETKFAPDSTGFSASRFVRWFDEKYGERSGRDWVKAHCIFGVKTHIITHIEIGARDAGDSPFFRPLVDQTAKNFKIEEVSADKAYLSHENLAIVDRLGGTAFVPFKSNSGPGEDGSLWNKMYGYYQFRREEFLGHYHLRSNAESGFSMVKAKFGDSVRSKIEVAMVNEALCKVLCHNLVVVHQSHIELGIEPVFWADKPVPVERAEPTILSFAKPG
jgi:transposase